MKIRRASYGTSEDRRAGGPRLAVVPFPSTKSGQQFLFSPGAPARPGIRSTRTERCWPGTAPSGIMTTDGMSAIRTRCTKTRIDLLIVLELCVLFFRHVAKARATRAVRLASRIGAPPVGELFAVPNVRRRALPRLMAAVSILA